MDEVQCQTFSSMELLEGNYNISTSSTNLDTMATCCSIPGPFTCNGCGTTFDTSCGLHTHMTNQHSDGSFHYDHLIKTAFPKFDSCCAGTQTSKMDKKYLRRYSRTGKPPRKVANVTVKSEVRDKLICMNLPSDEPAPQTGEDGNQDEVALTQSVSSVPYKFRTTTRLNRLSLQDCFVQLDSLEISQFENANDVKKKALNTIKKERMHMSDRTKTGIINQEPLDNPLSTVKRKRGRPRKIKVSLFDTTMDSEKSLMSANDTICSVSIRGKDKRRETYIKNEVLDEPDYEMDEDDNWDDVQTIAEVDQKHTDQKSNTAEKRISVSEADINEDKSKSASQFDNSGAATDIQQTVKGKHGRPIKIKDPCDTTIDNEKGFMSANDNICPVSKRKKHKSRETDITDFPDTYMYSTKRKRGTRRKTGISDEDTSTDGRRDKRKVKENRPKTHVTKFICYICGKNLWSNTKESHMNKHLGLKPYVCDVCSKAFSSKDILRIHQKYHARDRGISQFSCSICQQLFVCKKTYTCHMYNHTGEKPIKCEQCGAGFVHAYYLKRHTRRVHAQEKNVKCSICDKLFFSRGALRTHHIETHAAPSLPCRYCGRLFKVNKIRKHHELTHTGEKQFYCIVCNHGFIQWSPYFAHMLKQHGFTKERVMELKKEQIQSKQPKKDVGDAIPCIPSLTIPQNVNEMHVTL